MDDLRFDGEVVLVTGAGAGRAGLGRAFALELARRGARVVVNDLGATVSGDGSGSPDAAEAVAEQIRSAGGEAIADWGSVADPAGAQRMVQAGLDRWGHLDAVVSNAGMSRNKPFDELTVEDFDAMVNVHLRGAFLVTQAAFRVMQRQPGGGRMIVITSSAGLLGSPGQSSYAAAKMGQIGLLRSVAHEGVEAGIRVNAVAPGAFTPAMIDELKASAISGPMASFDADLLDRMTPDRVAPLVVALAHRSCPCTGQVFCGWGGYYGRAWVTMNRGWLPSEGPSSAEELVAHWEDVSDPRTGYEPEENGITVGPATIQRAR